MDQWTPVEVKDYLFHIMDERDKRYEERFLAQEEAMKTALTSAKEAVTKAEIANEKRFDSVNEFRETLRDQTSTFMPRSEVQLGIDTVTEKINSINAKLERMDGKGIGINQLLGYLFASAALIVTILTLITKLH
jgi:hypothetical protein